MYPFLRIQNVEYTYILYILRAGLYIYFVIPSCFAAYKIDKYLL